MHMTDRLLKVTLKFIYSLFILWIGVLSPLIYFDLFAVNHFVQPYHFVPFKLIVQKEKTTLEKASTQLKQQLFQRFKLQQDFIDVSSFPAGHNHLFQWAMSQLYLVAGVVGAWLLFFGRLNSAGQPNDASADLPPPDKPPQFVVPPA